MSEQHEGSAAAAPGPDPAPGPPSKMSAAAAGQFEPPAPSVEPEPPVEPEPSEAPVEPVEPEQPGRRRWAIVVPVVTAAAGLMFAMSFRAAQGNDLRADRDLPQLILEANEHVAAQVAALDSLQAQVDRLSAAAVPGDARLQGLTSRADSLAPDAARTAVRGPAITVSLDDSDVSLDSLPDRISPDDLVIHQQDVQAVVNALWASGAEAMMIQDQRVISTSAVRCVGNTLILQGRVYSPPYVITAIGDPKRMEAALEADPVLQIYQQYVAAVGLGWDVSVEKSKQLPGYAGSTDLAYAQALR